MTEDNVARFEATLEAWGEIDDWIDLGLERAAAGDGKALEQAIDDLTPGQMRAVIYVLLMESASTRHKSDD